MDNEAIAGMLTDIHENLTKVRMDIVAIQTDIVWVKRIVGAAAVAAAAFYGLDISGVM